MHIYFSVHLFYAHSFLFINAPIVET